MGLKCPTWSSSDALGRLCPTEELWTDGAAAQAGKLLLLQLIEPMHHNNTHNCNLNSFNWLIASFNVFTLS